MNVSRIYRELEMEEAFAAMRRAASRRYFESERERGRHPVSRWFRGLLRAMHLMGKLQ